MTDAAAARTDGGSAALTVREAGWVILVWRLPLLATVGCFLAAAAVLLLRPLDPGATASVTVLWRRTPADPATVRLLFVAVVAALIGTLVGDMLRALLRSHRTTLRVTRGGAVAHDGDAEVSLEAADLASLGLALRPFGATVRIPGARRPMVVSRADLRRLHAFLALAGHRRPVRDDTPLPFPRLAPPDPALAPGERVAWRGHPGWRALPGRVWIAAALGALPALAYAALLRAIWRGEGDLALRLFATFGATLAVGASAMALAAFGWSALGALRREAAADLLVTDRRLAWRDPRTGEVFRAIPAADLLGVTVVERRGGRGWVALSIRDAGGEVREVDLHGVPDPDGAAAAIATLIPPA